MHPREIVIAIFLIVSALAAKDSPCTKQATIIDDDELNQIVEKARERQLHIRLQNNRFRFLETRPHPFTRLDSTILIPQSGLLFKAYLLN